MLNVSDATIRRFLLAQLSPNDRTAFEAKLFTDSPLEQRTRLIELELIDDHAAGRLSTKERQAFQQKFLVAAARQRKLQVSNALLENLADDFASRPGHSSLRQFAWPRLAWKVALAVIALAVVLASALVIRKEPKIVRQIIPKRLRPAAVPSPSPQAAHHPTNSIDSPEHRDEPQQRPPHEASPATIVLNANVPAESATVVSLANASNVVRLELRMEQAESATFALAVTFGEQVVYSIPELPVENTERIDIDIPVDRFKPGDFQVTLTRLNAELGVPTIYYFRVQ